MIVFLTLCYCALLFVLVKIKVLRPTMLVKLSPVLFILLMFLCLFVPMMFWAPSGNVIITQNITRMTPRVGGRIVKIYVKPNVRIKKGDKVLTVDPAPYQDQVNALQAQLAAAKQNVLVLKATLDAATSSVAQAKAQRETAKATWEATKSAVVQAKAQRESAKASLAAATSSVLQAKAQRDNMQSRVQILQATRRENESAVSKLQLEQATQNLAEAQAAVQTGQANEQKARVAYDSETVANIQTAEDNEKKARTVYEVESVAAIQTAEANEQKARLAYEAQYLGVNTTVAQVQAELAKAQWDLNETTVYAPADGFVTDFVLNEGSAISIMAGNAMINFVPDDEPIYVIAAIQEKNLRYVEAGQVAEVVLPLYPGETLTGKVEEVVWVTGEGQIMPQAQIPVVAKRVVSGGEFGVKIKLDPEWAKYHQPIGAGGMAAIYTDKGKPTHVIRKVMMRMNAWMNYIFQMPGQ